MGKSRSSSSESSGSTSSSSSSVSSAASGRHHKFNSEKKRRRHSEDAKRNSNARRGRSRSRSRQKNISGGREDRIRNKSTDQRVDKKRISSISNERHSRSSGDGRRDKRRSNSVDKWKARKHSSDDRRRARKRSSSDDRRRQRKRSSSDDKIVNRKRSNSDDSSRRRHRRYGSTDGRRNRKRSHSDDRARERKESSSDERNLDKKRSSIGQKGHRKESKSNDRRSNKSKRNSHSSDRSQKLHSRYRSGSEESMKKATNMKRKSVEKKSRDESVNKKSKFEDPSKKTERNNSRKSKERNVIIPSIPCKWDRVDDTSREGESDDFIKSDTKKENQIQEINKEVVSVGIKNSNDVKADFDSEVIKKSYSDKIIKSKIVAEEIMCSSNKEKSDARKAIVEINKLTDEHDHDISNNKEDISIKKSLTKDPISFSIKSIRKDHKKKYVGKESKNKSKEATQKEEIFQSGYETDSESEIKEEKSTKHHKRSKKKSIDSDKIMSESEDELQKMKAQLQKELELEEELERREKVKFDEKKKPDYTQNLEGDLEVSLKPKNSEDLKSKSKGNLHDIKTSRRSDRSRELKKSHSEKKEKLFDTPDSNKKSEKIKNYQEDITKDSKISSPGCKENKKDGLMPSASHKEEQKLDMLKNSKENSETSVTSSSEIKKIKESSHSRKVGSFKESSEKNKESSLSHKGANIKVKKEKENLQNLNEDIIKDHSINKVEVSSSRLEDTKTDLSSNVVDKKQDELTIQKENNLETSKASSKHEDTNKELGSQSKLYSEDNKDNLKSSSWAGHGSDPLLTELPAQSSRTPKTSDTYWNKYADKFGIIIDDPKYLADDNENVNKKRKLSPVEVHRKKKGRDDETKDSVACSGKLGKDSKSVSQNEKTELTTTSLKKTVTDQFSSKTGGAYIPPARLKMMQDQITDKSSAAYQRLAWEALKKSINGLVNKVNVSNIGIIVRELFKENIVRGRGLLCRAIMQAQAFSPTFTHVYAAMVAVINTKFPQIGELLLHRLVLQLRRGVKRNDKNSCMASCRFIGHLINQQVAHEVVALEILTMLLEKAKDLTDESEVGDKSRKASVELAIAFLKECGMKLSELTPKGLMIVMETLRNILHEGKLDSRFQYMVEVLMAIKKGGFKDYPAVLVELDLVEEEDQFTHVIELDGKLNTQEMLNVFKVDSEFEENETKYKELKASILGGDTGDESGGDGSSESGAESDDEGSEAEKGEDGNIIIDRSETNLVAFRRTVYLTIQSSLDVDECAHKLLKGEIKPGWEEELCNMIIDCCAQQRTYMKFYGLLAQRFCMLNKIYQQYFEKIFKDAYETCHRLEIEKLRNVAKLFSHLFFSDAISWESFSCIHLNQDETTSSSRVFLKILFEELGDFMGLCKLNERLRDPTLAPSYEGLLPRDNPVNTRFAINFFTTIGLGGLTDDLREFLRSQPKPTAVVAPVPQTSKDESSDTSSSSSDSSSEDSSSSSDSSSDSSSSEDSSSDSDSSSSESSSSGSSISDSSNSDSNSSEDSSSDDSYKKSLNLKNKKKLLKKLQMQQRKASKKKRGSKDKKKNKADSSKILKYKVIDEGKAKKLSKNDRNNLVFENKKVVEKSSDRHRSNNNPEFNSNHDESSDESSNGDTRARRVGESSKKVRSKIEENNYGKEKQRERYSEMNSKRRKMDHSSDREERIRSRLRSREKSNEPQEKGRRNRDELSSRNSNENSKEKQVEVERRSKMSERSESSEREEKDEKKQRSKEVENEKNKCKRENYKKEDKKEKKKDLRYDERKKEKRREKDDSDKEEETDSHHRRRNKEKDNKEYESKSKSSRDKDRDRKEDRRSRRLSQV